MFLAELCPSVFAQACSSHPPLGSFPNEVWNSLKSYKSNGCYKLFPVPMCFILWVHRYVNATKLKAKYFTLLGNVLSLRDRNQGACSGRATQMTKAWEKDLGGFSLEEGLKGRYRWNTALNNMLRLNLKQKRDQAAKDNCQNSFTDTLSWTLHSIIRNCFKSSQVHATTKYSFHQGSHAWRSSHMLLSTTEAAKSESYRMPNPSEQTTTVMQVSLFRNAHTARC